MRIILTAALALLATLLAAQADQQLWYDRPAGHFEESLLLGNGRAGISVYGGIRTDKISLNEATLWSGSPVDAAAVNPQAHTHLVATRAALKAGDYHLADSLNRLMQGKYSESYLPFGTLYIDMAHEQSATAYRRSLDLTTATATTQYTVDGVTYTREYFVSHPRQAIIIRLRCDKPGKLDFDLRFDSPLRHAVSQQENVLTATGQAPAHVEPSYLGDIPNAIVYDEAKGIRFCGKARISGAGQLVQTDTSIGLRGGQEAHIVVALATNFVRFNVMPNPRSQVEQKIATQYIKAAFAPYEELRREHLADYQNLYNRVKLRLAPTQSSSDQPTDQRLRQYAEGGDDRALETLYFHFGRYLLISSSRTPSVPANLQGIWNEQLRAPWSSNYTTNINLPMNYWLAEPCGLPEMHQPLIDFIFNLAQTGTHSANNFYKASGWSTAHNSDIWAMSNPAGNYGQGDPNWANWNMGGAWLANHLWEHFRYTRDTTFLRYYNGQALLKGAAQFCMDILIYDLKGKLITSPATSPENRYRTPKGYIGATAVGTTADMAITRELFQNCIDASKTIDFDPDSQELLARMLKQLSPYKTGKNGQLQEWYEDWDDENPQHRHQSHLYGLYPGTHISPTKTPELAQACRRSLEQRGDEGPGWAKAWRANLWARLGDGDHAYKLYRGLLRSVLPTEAAQSGTYPNLTGAHPPFQIDGNFGATAAVCELLLQSHQDGIDLLPALPKAWADGTVEGLRARGGYKIDMEWANSKIRQARISSELGGKTSVRYAGQTREIILKKGEQVTLRFD
jgi:alpha-L-fucosidase 2